MSVSTVRVSLPSASYDVVIGPGALEDAGKLIREVARGRSAVLVTDDRVGPRYGMSLSISLSQAGFTVRDLTVEAGESSKNWQLAGSLLEEIAKSGTSREDVVVALGGGVVGDLVGFVAATYQRGVDFVQVPTTLLAMVDSSVGGKTGVDLAAGKNLAGAFKQPLVVIADTSTLSTLPDEEWKSGLAEVAKSAVLEGEEFFEWVETNAAALVARDPEVVVEAVCRCVAFKASVVARDEKEAGPRECLNYGHTLGHALEKELGYGTITHGAAVAEGMRFASRVSMEVGQASPDFVRRQDGMLDALGIAALGEAVPCGLLLESMRADKKARARVVRMVLVDGPGIWRCVRVPDDVVTSHLEAWAQTKKG